MFGYNKIDVFDFPTKNFDKAVGFYRLTPSPNFTLQTVTSEKPFLMSRVGCKIVENCLTKTIELHAMRARSSKSDK